MASKTYAEMVKEDKEKGKKKVLDRRKKEKAASFFKTFIADTKKKLKNKGKAEASTKKVTPTKDKKTVKETKKTTPTVTKGSTIKVKSGNTLSQIAKDKGITLKALLAANPEITNPNMIKVGQTIKIPTKGKGSVYEGMSKKKMASMAMKQGGASMKKKTKYMQKGGVTKKSKMMNKGGAMKKKSKMMNKGGAMKKTKYMAKGGAAKRR